MKKICMALLLAVMAITVRAQVTANVRVGGGVGTYYPKEGAWHIYDETHGFVTMAFQANIPFSKGSSYTFSPSLFLIGNPESHYFEGTRGLLVPLQVGKKIHIATNTLFFPKLGATLGSQNNGFRIGPSLALAIETGHFVTSLDAYVSLKEEAKYEWRESGRQFSPFAATLSFGYKF